MKDRRSFVAALSLSALAGCLDSNSGDDNSSTKTDGTETGDPATKTDEGDAGNGTATEKQEGDGPEMITISEKITEDRTLSGDSVYRVTDHLRVEAALTIEPGATLAFEEGTGLDIVGFDDGSLIADGTAAEEIVFTATQETPGWWNGIFFETSGARNNVLNHVAVEYGGRDNEANVVLNSSTYLPITNATFSNSDGYGLYIDEDATIPDASSNEYTENEQGAVRVSSNTLHYLDTSSSFTGNETDAVVVHGKTLEDDHVDNDAVTWGNLGVPYRVQDSFHLRDIEVTVEPGSVFEFEEGVAVTVADGGALVAEGTPDERIVFTATDDVPGWWHGISVPTSHSRKNLLKHAVVEYGGRDTKGNVHLSGGRFEVTDSTLRHSEALGLWADDGSTVNDDVCEVNEYHDNAKGACTVES